MQNNKQKAKITFVSFTSPKDKDRGPPEQDCSSGALVVLLRINPPAAGAKPRASQKSVANRLHIPPSGNLVSWDHRTAPDQGRKIRDMVSGYVLTAAAHNTPPPGQATPRPVLLIMVEASHFYHVRVVLQPETGRWDLEVVDSMIATTAPLPNSLTTLDPVQPPGR